MAMRMRVVDGAVKEPDSHAMHSTPQHVVVTNRGYHIMRGFVGALPPLLATMPASLEHTLHKAC